MAFVSVIMPNFNNGRFIEQWAAPLIGDPAVGEIIVYDNGSTDGSPDLLEQLGSPKIRVIRGEQNLGATLGRHAAMQHARGELICFIDGDDWLEERTIERAVERLEADDLDFALFQCSNVNLDGENPVVTTPTADRIMDGRTACGLTMGGWFTCGWGVFRRSVYEQAWANFAPHGFLADEVLVRRMLAKARRVGPSSGRMFYRVGPKMRTPEQMIDWGRSHILALALAMDSKLEPEAIRRQLRMTVRSMFGITSRALAGRYPRDLVARALDEYFELSLPWAIGDAAWYGLDRFVRLARPMLGS